MRQYLFPAILALSLHGLLLGIVLPHRPITPPKLPGIPVEIAIRPLVAKSAATKKKTAPQPAARPATAPPPKAGKKLVPMPQPAISKKPAAIKNAPRAALQKESRIEKQREEAQSGPPAPPSPATAHTEEPARAVAPAFSSVPAEAEEPAAATPAALAPPVRRQLAVPAYQRNRQPEYPPMARRRGYTGTIILKVLVDVQGRVADLTVEQSSGHRILDQEALKAVRQWLFSPATDDGTPVSMWVSVPITFQLQDQ